MLTSESSEQESLTPKQQSSRVDFRSLQPASCAPRLAISLWSHVNAQKVEQESFGCLRVSAKRHTGMIALCIPVRTSDWIIHLLRTSFGAGSNAVANASPNLNVKRQALIRAATERIFRLVEVKLRRQRRVPLTLVPILSLSRPSTRLKSQASSTAAKRES